ncbi:MAG: phosphate transport system permease protein [Rickettsiales bacterium]|jgi:phosphate transport system permease protein
MLFLAIAAAIIAVNFFFLKQRIAITKKNAPQNNSGKKNLEKNTYSHSLKNHYLYCFVIWAIIFLIAIVAAFSNLELLPKMALLFTALSFCSFTTIFLFKKTFNAKKHLENITKFFLILSTSIGVIITFLITLSILFEALKFFKMVSWVQFLFGLSWNPQVAVHAGQTLSNSSFGIVPVFMGTLLITTVALAVAIPLGLMGAIYLAEYSKSKTRNVLKPILEILAGVPTVVYGYFAVIMVAPFLKGFFANFGVNIASESALGAGLVMGIMIIPFILSLSDDAINAVPSELKNAALAMGSTKSEMIKKVVLVSAFPSIISAILLAFSRAIGETMIVVMAAGLVAKLTFNPLDSVTTATAQIVTLLVGDQDAESPKTLAAFAIGLVLLIMTLIFNIIALVVVKRYNKKYR